MVYTYNKLVRDKILEGLDKKGLKYTYSILDNSEYSKELNKKLLEESNEYIQDQNIEEIADIMEVLMAIINNEGYTMEEVQQVMDKKREAKGAFRNKIFLKEVEEN